MFATLLQTRDVSTGGGNIFQAPGQNGGLVLPFRK
jgi:hypothetical protein